VARPWMTRMNMASALPSDLAGVDPVLPISGSGQAGSGRRLLLG
jgi:hypothetical protein